MPALVATALGAAAALWVLVIVVPDRRRRRPTRISSADGLVS